MTDADPYGGGMTLADIDRILDQHAAAAAPIRELKVTREQLDEMRRVVPTDTSPSPAALLFGLPVVLVDAVEESTPFDLMMRKSLLQRLGDRP